MRYPECGGPEGDRTLDLRVANAALSQLSHGPLAAGISFKKPACIIIRRECRFVKGEFSFSDKIYNYSYERFRCPPFRTRISDPTKGTVMNSPLSRDTMLSE